MKVSVRPSTYVAGGSLVDDIDVTVKEAAFVMFDYAGTTAPTPALGIVIVDPDGTEHEEYLSAGKPEYFAPSEDGEHKAKDGKGNFLTALTDKTAINNGTNLAKFYESLVNSGFPEDKLDEGANILNGLQFHLLRVVADRKGLIRTGKNANRQSTNITCSKIVKLPWESKSAAVGGGLKAAAKPNGAVAPATAASAGDDEAKAKAEETIMVTLMNKGEPMAKAALVTAVFAALKGEVDAATQRKISQLALNDAFLKSLSGIKLEGGKVSLAE